MFDTDVAGGVTCEAENGSTYAEFADISIDPAVIVDADYGGCTHTEAGRTDQLAYAHCKAATNPFDCLGRIGGTAAHTKECTWIGLEIASTPNVGWYRKVDSLLYDATFAANNFLVNKNFLTVEECAQWCIDHITPWPIKDLDDETITNIDNRCGSFNWRQRGADSYWCTINAAGSRESADTVTADQ